MQKQYRYYDVIMALFVVALMLSNLLSSAKIIDLGISIGSVPFIFDAGTLVFPISYIFGDILTEVYGFHKSRRVIWMGFIATALMGGFVWLAGVLPAEATWLNTVGQGAYDAVLGGISGLLIASLVGYFVGEFANSTVLAKMKVATSGRWLPLRTITSTIAGQFVDTIAFFLIAGVLGVFPSDLIPSLVITNYLLKVGIEVVFTPVTLLVVNALKQAEHEDYFDTNTDFNPFHLKMLHSRE